MAHEAVHTFHGQITSEDLGLLENLGWFVEGLATYGSGQFDKSHAVRAREAVEDGLVPEQLTKAWTVPYRYGVAEAMAVFIDGPTGLSRRAEGHLAS